MIPKIKIFCDFDGTITHKDVWIESMSRFIEKNDEWKSLVSKYEKEEIGSREFIIKECSLVNDFDFNKFNETIDKQEIDTYFGDFAAYCKSNSIPVYVLSEGVENYIERLFKLYGIDLQFFANKLIISEDKKNIGLEFPYSDSECNKCGCCKRNLLLNLTSDDEISIFIGDEFPDGCAAGFADIVFAKKSLASYCWKNNITYFEYSNFLDIKNKLEKIFLQKRLKHRQTAIFKRREVYLRG